MICDTLQGVASEEVFDCHMKTGVLATNLQIPQPWHCTWKCPASIRNQPTPAPHRMISIYELVAIPAKVPANTQVVSKQRTYRKGGVIWTQCVQSHAATLVLLKLGKCVPTWWDEQQNFVHAEACTHDYGDRLRISSSSQDLAFRLLYAGDQDLRSCGLTHRCSLWYARMDHLAFCNF